MKRFIILTSTIRNMGGAQMYAANKLAYYESLGWKPDIFFHNEGPVRINYLKQFEGNLIPELIRPFRSCSREFHEIIAHRILYRFDKDDEILIECHTPELAYWGEYLAQKARGKNTIYLLEENFPRFTKGELDFYEFKYSRRELMNSFSESLSRIFQGRYDEVHHVGHDPNIKAYCDNVLDYTPIDIPMEVRKASYSIISIGRLDKPYIKPMLDEIYKFSQKHTDKIINLIVAGGDLHNLMPDYIKEKFSSAKNVQLSLLGYIIPIPYDWIKISDVSIASSNSILVSANEGVPTIGIDIHDFQPIGIYGYTTNNLWTRENEPVVSISEWLESVLIKGEFKKKLVNNHAKDDVAEHLKPHYDLLMASDKTKEYYDVEGMYSLGEKLAYSLKKVLRPLYSRIRRSKR